MFLPAVLNEYWKFDTVQKRQKTRKEKNETKSLLKVRDNWLCHENIKNRMN